MLSSALLTFAVQHQVMIFHKYLEVGHTHMECDSVHSTIDKKVKQVSVNLTSDYINIIQSARKKGVNMVLSILTILSFNLTS